MSTPEEFKLEQISFVENFSVDPEFRDLATNFYIKAATNNYTYVWNWLGLPVIQYPNDLISMQEIIWNVRPTVIIETGIARGGSLLFYAGILKIIGGRKVLGVDNVIHEHNRDVIEQHILSEFITLIEGDSADADTARKVSDHLSKSDTVLVVLDSDHTHSHVLNELINFYKFVSVNSYFVVFDTTCNQLTGDQFKNLQQSYVRDDWNSTRNPGSAVNEFLVDHPEFEIEDFWHKKALITNCWNGFLRRTR